MKDRWLDVFKSRWSETLTLVLAAAAVAFMLGYFMGARSVAETIQIRSVETGVQLTEATSGYALPKTTSRPQVTEQAEPAVSEAGTVPGETAAPEEGTVTEASDNSGTESGKVNINTADAAQLETLPGIGQVRAQAIIDYREANGRFAAVEDITLVNGIGDGILGNIRDLITVG